MDLNFLGNLSKLAQALIAVAVLVIAIGAGVSFMRYGTVGLNQKVDKLESQMEIGKKTSIELRQAIAADPEMKQNHPQLVDLAKRQVTTFEVDDANIGEPYYFNLNEMMALGHTYIEDEYGKYIKATFITDIFLVPTNSRYPNPKSREEITFAELIIQMNYLQRIFNQDKYNSLQNYVPRIKKELTHIFDEYDVITKEEKKK